MAQPARGITRQSVSLSRLGSARYKGSSVFRREALLHPPSRVFMDVHPGLARSRAITLPASIPSDAIPRQRRSWGSPLSARGYSRFTRRAHEIKVRGLRVDDVDAPPHRWLLLSKISGRLPMEPTQRRELTVFAFLTLVLAPVIAVIIVAAYGFCVWMYQLLMGPPAA